MEQGFFQVGVLRGSERLGGLEVPEEVVSSYGGVSREDRTGYILGIPTEEVIIRGDEVFERGD